MGLSAFAFLGSFLSIRLYYSYLVLIPKLVGNFLAVCLNLLALFVCHSSCPIPDDSICLSSQFRRFKFSHSNHQLLSWTCIMPTINSSSDRTLFQPSFCSIFVSWKKTMEQNDEHLSITNNRHLSISSTLSKFHILHLQFVGYFSINLIKYQMSTITHYVRLSRGFKEYLDPQRA